MEKDFNNFQGYMPFDMQDSMNDIYKDLMFNPVMQYEQAYSYYKYLSMQMDYKIKCKEYEKMCISNQKREPQTN